jgi:hypothetical protein
MGTPYGSTHQRIRRMMLDPPVMCAHCQRERATTLDHDPPLAMHKHRPNSDCCRLIPSCMPCNNRGGVQVMKGLWRPNAEQAAMDAPPEPVGLDAEHPAWRRAWLRDLRAVPEDGVWPRLMTAPHARAVDSLGADFVAHAEERMGRPLRWWQRLVATRMLEVDGDRRLVWETVLLSTNRQVGKSWLLRELCLWRMLQGERFGEAQDIMHTGKDVAICKEIQRPARIWAKDQQRAHDFKVREVNGQEEIELLADGSRWMIRAKEAVYGYATSFGVVDEAWKVKQSSIDEGLTPTMAEREQPQLMLVSTAHRLATKLMLDRRALAVDQIDAPTDTLLMEWSAPRDADLDDVAGWRQASPYWTPRRKALIAGRLDAMRAGDGVEDPEEPDPEMSFRCQWLNQWPRGRTSQSGPTEPLLAPGAWADLAREDPGATGGVWVALEDDYGLGAAVACVRRTKDGRLELDGWLRRDWDSAIADAVALADGFHVKRLYVGASLVDRVPAQLRGITEARAGAAVRDGLALLRDLVSTGGVVHDEQSTELDETLALATVREGASGLALVAKGPTHLVKACAWALLGAHRPAAAPAVY